MMTRLQYNKIVFICQVREPHRMEDEAGSSLLPLAVFDSEERIILYKTATGLYYTRPHTESYFLFSEHSLEVLIPTYIEALLSIALLY